MTLIWIIESLRMPQGVSTKSIGRKKMRMEHPHPPSNGLTAAIGRSVTLTSLPMSIDGEVSTALINFPCILITHFELKALQRLVILNYKNAGDEELIGLALELVEESNGGIQVRVLRDSN